MEHQKPQPTEAIQVNGIQFSHGDIYKVVDVFYRRVASDSLLSVPFSSVHDWPEHIERLTHFWWLRFGGRPYMAGNYNPILKHFEAGFNETFLERWLSIFHTTLRENLNLKQADFWIDLSERMGHHLSSRNEMYKKAYEQKNHP